MKANLRIRTWALAAILAVVAAIGFGLALAPKKIMEFLLPDYTTYSRGYNSSRWSKVEVGMTEVQVLSLMGDPLEVLEAGQGRVFRQIDATGTVSYPDFPESEFKPESVKHRWLLFSKPGAKSDNYYVRSVRIDRNGKVDMVESTFNLD